MAYQWSEYTINYNGEDTTRWSIVIAYNDPTPCYNNLKGEVKFDTYRGEWVGEVGGTNQMAEYLSNGWDCFFRSYGDDPETVLAECDEYIDQLVEGGNVPQDWIDEHYIY